jgi:hypothetical protein
MDQKKIDDEINKYIQNNKDNLFDLGESILIDHKDEILMGILGYLQTNKDSLVGMAEFLVTSNKDKIIKTLQSFIKDNNKVLMKVVSDLLDQNKEILFKSIKDYITLHSLEIKKDTTFYLEKHKKQIEELVKNYTNNTITRSNITILLTSMFPFKDTGNIFTNYFVNQSTPVIESYIVNELYRGPERLKIKQFTILISFIILGFLFSVRTAKGTNFLSNTFFFLITMLGTMSSSDYIINGAMRTAYKRVENVKGDNELNLIEVTEYIIGIFLAILVLCSLFFWMKQK